MTTYTGPEKPVHPDVLKEFDQLINQKTTPTLHFQVLAEKTIPPHLLPAWDIYYASVCAMYMHPGNLANGATLENAAEIADAMLLERIRRTQCPG